MTERIEHYQVNGRYKVQFERGAVKGVIGVKVEANGDVPSETVGEAEEMFRVAISLADTLPAEKKES